MTTRMTAAEVAAIIEAEAERRQSQRRRRPGGPSRLEEALAVDLADRGLSFKRQHHFKPAGHRNPYLFDFAFPELRLAVEVEGGTWVNGGHSRGKAYERNCRKYNLATLAGWRILRYTCDQVTSGHAGEQIAEAVELFA